MGYGKVNVCGGSGAGGIKTAGGDIFTPNGGSIVLTNGGLTAELSIQNPGFEAKYVMADLSVRGNPNTYYARMKVWVAIESNNSVSVDSVDGTADTGAALVISGFSQKTATNTAAYIQVPILTVANPATYISGFSGITLYSWTVAG